MTVYFYRFPITTQIFHVTKHTFALVNLKPIVPGHVLVVPLRRVPRLSDLPADESIDFFQTIQRVQKFIQHVYRADALNLGIQDGVAAGQSVPHVHCHIIPRYMKDGWGDGIYNALDYNEGMMKADYFCKEGWWKEACQEMGVENDEDRKPRSMEDMEKEANWLKERMNNWLKQSGEWVEEFDMNLENIHQD